jgi:hypothetical protein
MHVRAMLALIVGSAAALGASRPAPRASHRVAPLVRADTNARVRDSLMNDVLQTIQGKENLPADSVFKNIKLFKGRPAGQMLRIMNGGWARNLGVGCAHCHVVGEWDKEDKVQKQIARDMSAMVQQINTQLLPAIKNLKSERPIVNCTTCHRGDVKPATSLPADPTRP